MNFDGLGAYTPSSLPVSGWWTLPDFPDVVSCEGRRFRRAGWKQPYAGVVEQYREDTPTNSMHLMVYADGHWTIDHIDEDNPDLGREVPHFFNDHPIGQFLKVAGCVVLVVAGLGAVAAGVAKVVQAASRA